MRLIIAEGEVFLEIGKFRYGLIKTDKVPTNIKHKHTLIAKSRTYKCCNNPDYLSQRKCKSCELIICNNCIKNNQCPYCRLEVR